MIGAKANLKSSEGVFEKKSYPICSECGSDEIILKDPYMTCSRCGITLDSEILSPQIGDFSHHAPLDREHAPTLIGSHKEQKSSLDPSTTDRLNILQNYKSNDKKRIKEARERILKILNNMQIPNRTLKIEILNKYIEIYDTHPNSSNLRSAEKIIPLLIYYYCKVHNIIINEANLRDKSGISRKIFNGLKKKVHPLLPEYQMYRLTGKKDYISRLLFKFINYFFENDPNIHAEFKNISNKLLHKLWNQIQNKSEENIAGIIATSTFFYLEKVFGERLGNLNKTQICNWFNATSSRVSEFLEQLIEGQKISCVKGKDKIVKQLLLIIEE